MSLLDRLPDPAVWEAFYEYKTSLACPKRFAKELRGFIDEARYVPVCEAIKKGEPFPLPKKATVGKLGSEKKRTVYTYPPDHNTVLKLLTWLMLRQYDGLFCPALFSFRPGKSAKDAVLRLSHTPGITGLYAYKADVSDYFNSAPVPLLVTELEAAIGEDRPLFLFLRRLLEEPEALDGNRRIREQKGMMAGTPLSVFYANLFLKSVDERFSDAGIPYARYSDDMILFADSPAALEAHAAALTRELARLGLRQNETKTQRFAPADGWIFLGFRFRQGEIDLAPASLTKLKQKMRRKTRALARWQKRNGLEGEKAALAFIRIFNRKLFENPADNELTWTKWFFPVLTTAASLREIDRYAEDCIRFLISGTHTKARYNVRYETIQKLGFRSLVHAYYDFRSKKENQEEQTT